LEGVGDGKIGMDCSVVATRHEGIFMVSTTDYFYPLVDDPYMQGKIGCANVLSDLYAMGVVNCDTMLMILATCNRMTSKEREIITTKMIQGFNDTAKEGNTNVTGGQTVINPWPIIGGVATAICKEEDFIRPENAIPGDVVILTKPLGTQVAVNVHQWLEQEENWEDIKDILTKEDAERAYTLAMESMARLNLTAAKLMHKHGAHGATDVTGFGILGHAQNLARNQKAAIEFELHTLPIIRHMKAVDDKVNMFSLMKGFSSETSGGLLICLPEDKAATFCKELEEIDKYPAWVVGRVIKSKSEDQTQNKCRILENPTIIEV